MFEEPCIFDCCGDQLFGMLHIPAVPSAQQIAMLVVVGGPQYRVGSHRMFVSMAREFASAGFPTLRFDYRGMGDSDGDPRSFEDIDDDIHAGVSLLAARYPEHGILLIGLCDAASAIMMHLQGAHPSVAGTVLLNPWVRTEATLARTYTTHYYGQRVLSLHFWADLVRGRIDVARVTVEFVKNYRLGKRRRSTASYIDRMINSFTMRPLPSLFVLSEMDLTAREFQGVVAEQREWAALLATECCSQYLVAGADHTLSTPQHLRETTAAVTDWLSVWRANEDKSSATTGDKGCQSDGR